MSGMTNYLETALLGHVFLGIPYTPPATVYLALYTTTPTDVGTDGVEVTGGSYVRKAVPWQLGAGSDRVNNSTLVTFADMPAADIAGAALVDALTGGNVLATAAAPLSVAAGEAINVDPTTLNFYLS